MTITWLDAVDSTQRYLIDALADETLQPPCAVSAQEQTQGQGSRGNRWVGGRGNLFVSFAVARQALPEDLKLESASIYFAWMMCQTLRESGSQVWLKWPNDLYLDTRKTGGIITHLKKENLICGIGVNRCSAPETGAVLDIEISQEELLANYFHQLEKWPDWKQIFRFYALEFAKSRQYSIHLNHEKMSLNDAVLCDDGAIICRGQRMYSLR